MALQISKVEVWACEIQDQPGGLADVLGALADAGASLDCVIARRQSEKPGSGIAFVTPVKGKRVQQAAASVGMANKSIPTLRVQGADKPGLGAQITRAIADAGVNTRGVSAATLGKQFVAYIGFDDAAGADKAAKALRSMPQPRAAAKRKR